MKFTQHQPSVKLWVNEERGKSHGYFAIYSTALEGGVGVMTSPRWPNMRDSDMKNQRWVFVKWRLATKQEAAEEVTWPLWFHLVFVRSLCFWGGYENIVFNLWWAELCISAYLLRGLFTPREILESVFEKWTCLQVNRTEYGRLLRVIDFPKLALRLLGDLHQACITKNARHLRSESNQLLSDRMLIETTPSVMWWNRMKFGKNNAATKRKWRINGEW